jgi:hypothetical protein
LFSPTHQVLEDLEIDSKDSTSRRRAEEEELITVGLVHCRRENSKKENSNNCMTPD